MNEAQFNQIVDELMFSIEETIDDSGADLDYENSAGMLTITCEANGSQIILSRQSAVSEIWLAAKSGGLVSGELLTSMLSEACRAQAGETIEFSF